MGCSGRIWHPLVILTRSDSAEAPWRCRQLSRRSAEPYQPIRFSLLVFYSSPLLKWHRVLKALYFYFINFVFCFFFCRRG